MSSNHFQDAKRIYGAALELDPDRRIAYVAQACAGDEALRKEVESLLFCRAEGDEFFKAPAMEAGAKALARESATDLTGHTLSHYTIVEKIAEGGMGVVYRARDTHLDREIALKILTPEKLLDPDRKRRFVQEAKAASGLNHPNIVVIHDIGVAEGVTFIAMEYVQGRTLNELIRGGRITLTEILRYGVQIADALTAAHRSRIIHRDIKPANIMVKDSGLVKVLDFGLAKLTDFGESDKDKVMLSGRNTQPGIVLGTAAYMSPEQAEGTELDVRSDIFSLGSVLYEMITGARAFRGGTNASTLASILRDEPKPICELAPETPREVERVVNRCLRKNPERRFQHMADLKVALEELKEESNSGALIPSAPRLMRFTRIAFVAAAIALIVTVGAAYWVNKPIPMPRIVASHALTKTGNRKTWGLNKVVTDGTNLYFQEDRSSRAATMQVNLSGGEVSELPVAGGQIGGLYDISRNGSELLLSIRDADTNRDDAWVQPLPTGAPRLIVKDARWPVWSSDGHSILFNRGTKDLYRVNIDGTDARHVARFPDVTDLSESPDGRRVRTGVAPTSRLWEVGSDGSNPHPIFADHTDSVAMGNWSPDGKYFFFLSWDGDRFNLWAASEERPWWKRNPQRRQLTFGPLWIGTPSVSKDGKQVYAVGREPHGELLVYDKRTRAFVPYLGGISAGYVDFSRDGQWIAYVTYPEGTLWRSRIDGTDRRQLTLPPLAVMLPRWSPDGKMIAFKELAGGDRRQLALKSRVYVVSAEGGGPTLLVGGDRSCEDPTWSPDGTVLAYYASAGGGSIAQSGIMIFDLQAQKSTKIPGSEGYWAPRWSPDGKYMAARLGLFPSKLALYSFATQQWQVLETQDFAWQNWSRDSKFIYGVDGTSLVRISVSNHKREQIAPIPSFPTTAYFLDRWGQGWFGMTPDGRPLTTRDTGIEEIYAFDLEYK